MATTTISTSFVGQGAMDFISKSLLEATSLKNGLVTLIPNVKYSYKLQIADMTNIIQADGCAWNDQGQVSIAERALTPAKLKVNLQDCKTTLEAHWQSEKMLPGALNSSWTATFKDWLGNYATEKVAAGIEKLMYQGNTAGTSSIFISEPFLTSTNGFVVKMKADGTVVGVTASVLTTSNILTEIDKVYQATPDAIYGDENLRFYVSRKTLKLYQSAIAQTYGLANSLFDITKKQTYDYKGISLNVCGIADNTIILAKSTNLFFGTDLESDQMEFKIIDMSDTDGSDYIRLKMRFSADVQHAIGAEIVLYS